MGPVRQAIKGMDKLVNPCHHARLQMEAAILWQYVYQMELVEWFSASVVQDLQDKVLDLWVVDQEPLVVQTCPNPSTGAAKLLCPRVHLDLVFTGRHVYHLLTHSCAFVLPATLDICVKLRSITAQHGTWILP